MKILLSVLLTIIFFSSFGQVYQRIGSNAEYNGIKASKEFYPPLRDTNWTPTQRGALTKRPQDSLNTNIYQWIGTWQKSQSVHSDIVIHPGYTDTSYQNNLLIGWRIRVFLDGGVPLKEKSKPWPSNENGYFMFSSATGTIQFPSQDYVGAYLLIQLY